MFKKLLYSISIVFLVGCGSKVKVVETSNTKTDSLKEKIVSYRDTTFTTQSAKATLDLDLDKFKRPLSRSQFDGKDTLTPRLEPKIFTKKFGNATATVKIKDSSVVVDCQCDSIKIAAKIKKIYEKESTTTTATTDSKTFKRTGVSLLKHWLWCIICLAVGYILNTIQNKFGLKGIFKSNTKN